MPEYIERDKAIDFVKNNTPSFGNSTTMQCVVRSLKYVPSADVVEVVRCKDCKKHYKDGFCDVFDVRTRAKDYCSYGERRCNDAESTL